MPVPCIPTCWLILQKSEGPGDLPATALSDYMDMNQGNGPHPCSTMVIVLNTSEAVKAPKLALIRHATRSRSTVAVCGTCQSNGANQSSSANYLLVTLHTPLGFLVICPCPNSNDATSPIYTSSHLLPGPKCPLSDFKYTKYSLRTEITNLFTPRLGSSRITYNGYFCRHICPPSFGLSVAWPFPITPPELLACFHRRQS